MAVMKGIVYKVVLVGEGGVGKTSLIKQFVYKQFSDKYMKTLGTNIYKKQITHPTFAGKNIQLQIWDVLGQKVFKSIIKVAFHNANGVIFVSDLTDRKTLEGLDAWVSYAYEHCPKASFIFLANKNDVPEKQFGKEELGKYSYQFNSPFFFTSAKTGENVEVAFTGISRAILEGKKIPPKEEVEIRKQSLRIQPNIQAEDQIITVFCQASGGFDVAMPIVREQFRKAGVDFERPSKEDLQKVIQSLVVYLEYTKGKDEAHALGRKLNEILKEKGL